MNKMISDPPTGRSHNGLEVEAQLVEHRHKRTCPAQQPWAWVARWWWRGMWHWDDDNKSNDDGSNGGDADDDNTTSL